MPIALDYFSTNALIIILVILLVASAFFSGVETAMMSINRYRLRNIAKRSTRWAKIAVRLLDNPSRLLSVILIGNNFVNVFSAAIATVLGVRYFGGAGVLISGISLTIILLIFAEVTPKTLGALYPTKLVAPGSFIVYFLSKLYAPLVFALETITNQLLRLIGIHTESAQHKDQLTTDELRTVLMESSKFIPQHHRDTLIGFLDLEEKTVSDIMTGYNDIVGVDLQAQPAHIAELLCNTDHQYLPVYYGDIEKIEGMLRVKDILLTSDDINKQTILQLTKDAYFVPEHANLLTQLERLHTLNDQIALVVDEYGKIKGLITVNDIIDDIMSGFVAQGNVALGHKTKDGSLVVSGSALLRDINKKFRLDLPTGGPKTVSGLVIEEITLIPKSNICVRIGHYQIDTLSIYDNAILRARIRVLDDDTP